MTTNEQHLADRFAQALEALHGQPGQSADAWAATWAEGMPPEGAELLRTLHALDRASREWRGVPAGDNPTLAAQDTGEFVANGPRPSSTHIGRYAVVRRLGAGGMGEVWLAHDPQLNRHVAIKVPHLGRDDELARQRFLREARSAANVKHSNICPLHDVGEADGRPYVVMEYIEGESLEARLKEVGRLDPAEAVRLARQVLAALAAVHARGMVHRDLKPANVMLNRSTGVPPVSQPLASPKDTGGTPVLRERAILTDFGLARGVEGHDNLSADGVIVGTPAYMSPEQAAGDAARIGPATDLYALGVVMYQMLTGRLPFTGQVLTIMHKIANEKPEPPSRIRADIPADLERIILRLLAKSPAERYADAASLDADLAAFAERGAVSRARPRRGWLLIGALAACAATVMIAFATVSGMGHQTRRTEEPVAKPAPTPPVEEKRPVEPATPLASLSADLELTAWNDTPGERRQGRLGRPGSVPVRVGESLRIRVEVNEPAYVYLLWIDGEGQINPLSPWNPALGFSPPPIPPLPGPPASLVGSLAALRLGPAYLEHRQVKQLQSPASLSDGWEVTGPDGYQLLLLLARRTPLPADVNLRELIGPVSRDHATKPAHFDWYCIEADRLKQVDPLKTQLRGPKVKQLGDPLIRIMTTLHPHFEAIHGVRFACVAK